MDGEKLMLEPWGVNSLRVRSRMMGEILDSDFALLPAKTQPVQIDINEHEAVIANGKIKAVL